MQNMYNPYYPYNALYAYNQPYMGAMNNPHYEELRIYKLEAHMRKLEKLIESINTDKHLEEDIVEEKKAHMRKLEEGDIEEEKLLTKLYRNQQAKKEMESTRKELSELKGIIHRHLGSGEEDDNRVPDAANDDMPQHLPLRLDR